jgi:CRISPR/Cas system-associated exonuclease Cas4 (RecB family)
MNILGIYQDYLRKVDKEHKKSREKDGIMFHASTAGSCFRKQIYSLFDFVPAEFDDRTLRVLRMGTIVHSDIEKALREYVPKEHEVLFIEHGIEIEDLNVIGTLDVAVWDETTKDLSVYDIKTAANYTWSKHFGRKDNRQKGSNENYKLQLGTYAFAMQRTLNPSRTSLYLLWYNKNNSSVREQIIMPDWIDNAITYWTELNEMLDEYSKNDGQLTDMLIPEVDYGVPFQQWECGYCPYYEQCPSTLADKKRKPRKRRTK